MAQFIAKTPDGQTIPIEAPDPQSAAMMVEGGGGQGRMQGGGLFDDLPTYEEVNQGDQGPEAPPQPASPGGAFDDIGISPEDQFRQAFDEGQDQPELAEAMDQRIHGEADTRGRIATAGNALSMGFGDEIMGLVAGGLTFAAGDGFSKGYDAMTSAARGDIERYAERHPVEHAAIDIAGSLPTAMVPGGAAVKGAGLASKVARGAGAGMTYGAVRGFGEGEGGPEERAVSAGVGGGVGAVVGGALPIAGRAIGKAVGRRAGQRAAPSVEQLDDAAKALYQRAEQAGVRVQPRALRRAVLIRNRVNAEGFDPQLHPNTARALARIETVVNDGQPMSLADVEITRRVIRQAISASKGPEKGADQRMAMRVLDEFDTWMNNLQPRDMIAGRVSGREAIQTVNEARSLWSRKSKGDILADLVERAKLDENTVGFEKALRREFRTLARNKTRMKVFTEGERKAIKDVAKGGNMGWVTNALASFAPDMSPIGAVRGAIASGVGFGAGGPVGAAALPAAALGAKKVGNAATRRALRRADAMVRGGGEPIDRAAAAAAEGYANRLLGTSGQAAAPALLPPPR